MKWARATAIVFLLAISAACLLANILAPASYAHQFRDLLARRPLQRCQL